MIDPDYNPLLFSVSGLRLRLQVRIQRWAERRRDLLTKGMAKRVGRGGTLRIVSRQFIQRRANRCSPSFDPFPSVLFGHTPWTDVIAGEWHKSDKCASVIAPLPVTSPWPTCLPYNETAGFFEGALTWPLTTGRAHYTMRGKIMSSHDDMQQGVVKYSNPSVAERVERWLQDGGVPREGDIRSTDAFGMVGGIFENGGCLDLSHCHCTTSDLETLAADNRIAPVLTRLNLSDALRDVTTCSTILQHLPQLTHLDVSQNHCTQFHRLGEFKHLPSLTHLNLSGNHFLYDHLWYKALRNLPQLRYLDLSYNWYFDRIALWEAGGHLNIADQELHEMAKCLPRLTHLNLHGNGLSDDPLLITLLKYLPYLTHLNLASNALSGPPSVDDINHLRLVHLELHDNKFDAEKLADIMKHLPNLTYLGLSKNGLANAAILAEGFKHLSQLVQLDVSHNEFSSASDLVNGLEGLRHLEALSLRSCKSLDDLQPFSVLLPANRGKLGALVIDGCDTIKYRYKLDEAVLQLTDAEVIFDAVPPADCNRRKPLPIVKAMILGDGLVGKTHLRYRLMARDPHYGSEPIASTESFEIERLPMQLRGCTDQTVEIRLFDFGGQPYLHGAHRLFLASERNIYIILLRGDMSPENAHLPYWLRMVQHHGAKQTPVILIRSWSDEQSHPGWAAWNVERVKEEFGLSCIWVDGYGDPPPTQLEPNRFDTQKLAEIQAHIERIVASMKSTLETEYDRGMLTVKRWIEGRQSAVSTATFAGQYITLADFEAACRRAGATSANETHLWRLILSHLGLITYLGDLPDADDPACRILRDYVFDTIWIKHAIYALIVPSELTNPLRFPNGIIPIENAEAALLKRGGGPRGGLSTFELHLAIAALRAIRILFDAQEATGIPKAYLLADLLSDEKSCAPFDDAPMSWHKADPLHLEFLSEAYLPRLIGELQVHLKSISGYTYRSWVIFTFKDQTTVEVLVRADLNAAVVHFYARGGDERSRTYRVSFVRDKMQELVVRDRVEILPVQIDFAEKLPPRLQIFISILTLCRRQCP
jgi:GTPase SAR1 family protein